MELKAKRYFSKVAGAHYTMPDGFQIFFHHGFYDFNPEKFKGEKVAISIMNGNMHPAHGQDRAEVYQAELEYLVNSGNPLIFDQEHAGVIVQAMPDALNPSRVAKSEAEIAAQDQRLATLAGRVTGESDNVNDGQITDPNASTVDAALRNVVFKEVGPGANTGAAAAREAAAKRLAEQQATTAQAQNKTNMS